MESRINYALIGVFVMVLMSALIGVAVWLVSDTSYRHYAYYLSFMNESVSGLNREAPVKYNGVDVGYVANISINPRNPQQVKLLLKIESDIPITESTSAMMVSQGLTGLRFIQLSVGDLHAPLLKADEAKYPIIPSKPSLRMLLDQTVNNALKDFDDITRSLQNVLDPDTANSVKQSMLHLETITGALAEHINVLTQTINDSQIVMDKVAKVSQDFPQMASLIEQTLQTVHATSKRLDSTAKDIAVVARQSGALVQQANEQLTPDLGRLVLVLTQLGEQFSDVLTTLEQQPGALLRGVQPAQLGPGE